MVLQRAMRVHPWMWSAIEVDHSRKSMEQLPHHSRLLPWEYLLILRSRREYYYLPQMQQGHLHLHRTRARQYHPAPRQEPYFQVDRYQQEMRPKGLRSLLAGEIHFHLLEMRSKGLRSLQAGKIRFHLLFLKKLLMDLQSSSLHRRHRRQAWSLSAMQVQSFRFPY